MSYDQAVRIDHANWFYGLVLISPLSLTAKSVHSQPVALKEAKSLFVLYYSEYHSEVSILGLHEGVKIWL